MIDEVTVEAMTTKCCVIGVESGGLLETVRKDEKVGYLCNPTGFDFAEKMSILLKEPSKAKAMGEEGRQRAIREFSLEHLADSLHDIVSKL